MPLSPNIQRHLDEQKRYIEALGGFVHTFARIEGALAITLWTMAGVTEPVAKAIFSGVRSDMAMNFISRILDATNADNTIKEDFHRAFTQLGHINRLRNDVLHYGVNLGSTFHIDKDIVESDPMVTSTRRIALSDDRVRETPISGAILKQMIEDLHTIQIILIGHVLRTHGRSDEAERLLRPARTRAWKYTPPQQASGRGKNRAKPPKRKRPPQSSQA